MVRKCANSGSVPPNPSAMLRQAEWAASSVCAWSLKSRTKEARSVSFSVSTRSSSASCHTISSEKCRAPGMLRHQHATCPRPFNDLRGKDAECAITALWQDEQSAIASMTRLHQHHAPNRTDKRQPHRTDKRRGLAPTSEPPRTAPRQLHRTDTHSSRTDERQPYCTNQRQPHRTDQRQPHRTDKRQRRPHRTDQRE